MTVEEIRSQFPALAQQVYGKPLVYLDNAATAQRPLAVLEKERTLASTVNANIHRAVHKLAADATEEYERTREIVADFLNAESPKEIVFTSGTTMSINLVAFCFGEAFIGEGDEIIVSVAEHHSNIVPWQLLCQRKKAVLNVLEIDEFGGLQVETLQKLISQRTKIIAISHISNVLGLVNPVREIIRIAHHNGIPVLVDGAQGSIHAKVDVQELDCDFYAFSGHKVYGATGTGVLYGKKKWLEAMPPYMGGGEMIETVRFSGTTFAPVPGKFEAGTQNFNAVPTLQEALRLSAGSLDGRSPHPSVRCSSWNAGESASFLLYGRGRAPRGSGADPGQDGHRRPFRPDVRRAADGPFRRHRHAPHFLRSVQHDGGGGIFYEVFE